MKIENNTQSLLIHLECPDCGKIYDHRIPQTFATCCNQPLIAKYDLAKAPPKSILKDRPFNMWRYKEFLPVLKNENIVSINEGFTPILKIGKSASFQGFTEVFIKDEAMNPTGSFKARGQSAAISKAVELGVTNCIIPTAGNAGGAMSAYCAKAGIKATVVMPSITPKIFMTECNLFGAEVILMDGLINVCGAKVREIKKTSEAFDVSTMKEPYRLEGKKTMGYEIAEQFDWKLPDVIIYPAGGGTGLIGIWKAFKEMKEMGWIEGPLPKMIAVQSANCQPVVKAYDDLHDIPNDYEKAKSSFAFGLAVPHSFGHDLMMKVMEESDGMAIAVSEEDIFHGIRELAQNEGFLLCPEGAATWQAMIQMKNAGLLNGEEKILLLNTGTAYKYMDDIQRKQQSIVKREKESELVASSMYMANE
ncbi:MAG: threonine synthase [Ginsengibacter sp.]